MKPWLLAALSLLALPGCGGLYNGIGFADFMGAPLGYKVEGPADTLAVATVALEGSQDPAENLDEIEAVIDGILEQAPATRLIVFGELALGWYYDPSDPEGYQRSVAQLVPGPLTDSLGLVAAERDIYLAVGLAELRDDALFNTLLLFGPDGGILAQHDKQNLNDWDLESGFKAGDSRTLVEVDGLLAALLICSDVESREVMKDLARQEPELLIHAWASTAAFGSPIDPSARMLSAWNLTANRFGEEDGALYQGVAYVSNPAGTHVADTKGGQGWAIATVEVPR